MPRGQIEGSGSGGRKEPKPGPATKISRRRGPRGKPESMTGHTIETGWECGNCHRAAVPDEGFTQFDARYTTGMCPVHGKSALVRAEKREKWI